jgi:hypothetical protein
MWPTVKIQKTNNSKEIITGKNIAFFLANNINDIKQIKCHNAKIKTTRYSIFGYCELSKYENLFT